jgi:hypothetical protein
MAVDFAGKMESTKLFKIKNENFNIKYAYLDAFMNETENVLIFGLQVKAGNKDDMFSGYDLHLNSEILLKIKPNEIKKWQDITGKIIQWDDVPEDEQEPHALLYVFEHEQVYNAKIEFKNIDNKIFVKLKALCDIYADNDFSNNLPLEIETEVDFFGILCGRTSEEECKNKINPYLDISDLKYVQNKYGVSLMIPRDSNMETNLLVLGEY